MIVPEDMAAAAALRAADEASYQASKAYEAAAAEFEAAKRVVKDRGLDVGPILSANCDHEWVSARNKAVQSGSICARCFRLGAHDTPELLQEPGDPATLCPHEDCVLAKGHDGDHRGLIVTS